MVVPKQPDTGSISKARKRGGRSLRRDIVMAIFCGWTFGMMILILDHVLKDQNAIDTNLKDINVHVPIKSIDAKNLDHEESFHKTIQSCVPGIDDTKKGTNRKQKKCGEFIPQREGKQQDSNSNLQRVAVITPPGKLGKLLYKHVQRIIKQYEPFFLLNNKKESAIELIHTGHVPPYGYGKSHGLTKIIRLIAKPILIGVVDALQGTLQSEEMHKDITLQDLKATLRQLVRFHCRLNHISAHTAIMTLDVQELIDNYEMTSAQIYDFLTLHDTKDRINEQKQFQMQRQQIMLDNNDDQVTMVSAELAFVSKMLTRIQAMQDGGAGGGSDIFDVLDQVLLDELERTKNLQDWPCQSFWTAGEASHPLQLSKFNRRIAQSLVPNCTSPFTSCWVERDKCEAKGDGKCKK